MNMEALSSLLVILFKDSIEPLKKTPAEAGNLSAIKRLLQEQNQPQGEQL